MSRTLMFNFDRSDRKGLKTSHDSVSHRRTDETLQRDAQGTMQPPNHFECEPQLFAEDVRDAPMPSKQAFIGLFLDERWSRFLRWPSLG